MMTTPPPDNFAAFILTHGRADNVKTVPVLRKHGYTGPIYIIIDNEDEQASLYYDRFGDSVIMFDKAAVAQTFDEVGRMADRRSITYARNACFDIARDLGATYFIQLDDDYTSFDYRFDSKHHYNPQTIPNKIFDLNGVFATLLDFFKRTPTLSVALTQTGDFIGGDKGTTTKKIYALRKVMNSFICSVERPFQFIGRLNEDVNTYTTLGSRGGLFLSFNSVYLRQGETQKNAGGITELYRSVGTYAKAMTTFIQMPSSTKVTMMGYGDTRRPHHRIVWNNTVPKIVPQVYQKT
jgi:hypothetical protein